MGTTTTGEIGFFAFYIPFLLVVLLLSADAGADLVGDLTDDQIMVLQDGNNDPLAFLNKLLVLGTVSSTFFLLEIFLLILSLIAAFIVLSKIWPF